MRSHRESCKKNGCIYYTCSHSSNALRFPRIQTAAAHVLERQENCECSALRNKHSTNGLQGAFADARAKQFLRRSFDSGQVNRSAMNNNSHAFHPCAAVANVGNERKLISSLCQARLTAVGSHADDANSTPCQDASAYKSCQRREEVEGKRKTVWNCILL